MLNRKLDSENGFVFLAPTGTVHRATTYWRVVTAATVLHAGKTSNVVAVKTT